MHNFGLAVSLHTGRPNLLVAGKVASESQLMFVAESFCDALGTKSQPRHPLQRRRSPGDGNGGCDYGAHRY